jgi:cell division control protein 12
VAGESGLGKTTFINTLFSTTIKNYADHKRRHAKQVDKTVEIEITKAELEEKFFKGGKRPYLLKYRILIVPK